MTSLYLELEYDILSFLFNHTVGDGCARWAHPHLISFACLTYHLNKTGSMTMDNVIGQVVDHLVFTNVIIQSTLLTYTINPEGLARWMAENDKEITNE